MIKINTYHIPKDEPLILEGKESEKLLELNENGDFSLKPLSDIFYHLSASMAGQDLLVTGVIQIQLETQCSRCLETIQTTVQTKNLYLLYEKCPDQEKDITEDIREELLLSIPDFFHCSDDCKGLCFHCGCNLNREKCSCGAAEEEAEIPAENNPWDALDQLNKK